MIKIGPFCTGCKCIIPRQGQFCQSCRRKLNLPYDDCVCYSQSPEECKSKLEHDCCCPDEGCLAKEHNEIEESTSESETDE
jgi:hypothetical protein